MIDDGPLYDALLAQILGVVRVLRARGRLIDPSSLARSVVAASEVAISDPAEYAAALEKAVRELLQQLDRPS